MITKPIETDMKKKIYLLVGLAVLLVASCSSSKTNSSKTKAKMDTTSLYGSAWKLVSVKSATSTALLTPNGERTPTLTFSADGQTVSGNSGCNSYSGKASWEGNQLTFGNLISTRKMCMDGMEMERAVLSALQGTVVCELTDSNLVLKKGSETVATFAK